MKTIAKMVMKLLPFDRFYVHVRSPLSDVIQRLSNKVVPGDLDQGFRLGLPYHGRITETGFNISRVIYEQRGRGQAIGPKIKGIFESCPEGTHVRISISPEPLFIIFLGILFLSWYGLFFSLFLKMMPKHESVLFLLAPMLALFSFWMNFRGECKRARQDLSGILLGQSLSTRKSFKLLSVIFTCLSIIVVILVLLGLLQGEKVIFTNTPTDLKPQLAAPYSNLTLTHQITVPAQTRAVAISPDNQTLVSGGDEKRLRVWDIETGELIKTLPTDDAGIIQFLEFGAGNDSIISGSKDGKIQAWNLGTGTRTAIINVQQGNISDMAIAADGKTVISTTWDGQLSAWNLDSGKPIVIPPLKSKETAWPFSIFANTHTQVWDIDLSQDGKNVAIAGDQVRLLNLETGEQTTIGHNSFGNSVDAVKYSPDSKTLVMKGDQELRMWDLTQKKQLFKLSLDGRFIGEFFLSTNGRCRYAMMQSIQGDHRRGVPANLYFEIWDLQTQKRVAVQPITGYKLAFSPNGKIVVNTGGNIIRIWKT